MGAVGLTASFTPTYMVLFSKVLMLLNTPMYLLTAVPNQIYYFFLFFIKSIRRLISSLFVANLSFIFFERSIFFEQLQLIFFNIYELIKRHCGPLPITINTAADYVIRSMGLAVVYPVATKFSPISFSAIIALSIKNISNNPIRRNCTLSAIIPFVKFFITLA